MSDQHRSHSLNDTCRFWLALAGAPDVIDDPKGLDHPLSRRAAQLGISPAEFSEVCREFQKLRAKGVDHPVEDGGIGHGLNLQSFNSGLQGLDFSIHQNSPQSGCGINATLHHQIMAASERGVEP